MAIIHSSHRTRRVLTSADHDVICNLCKAAANTNGNLGQLIKPCPASDKERQNHDNSPIHQGADAAFELPVCFE